MKNDSFNTIKRIKCEIRVECQRRIILNLPLIPLSYDLDKFTSINYRPSHFHHEN